MVWLVFDFGHGSIPFRGDDEIRIKCGGSFYQGMGGFEQPMVYLLSSFSSRHPILVSLSSTLLLIQITVFPIVEVIARRLGRSSFGFVRSRNA